MVLQINLGLTTSYIISKKVTIFLHQNYLLLDWFVNQNEIIDANFKTIWRFAICTKAVLPYNKVCTLIQIQQFYCSDVKWAQMLLTQLTLFNFIKRQRIFWKISLDMNENEYENISINYPKIYLPIFSLKGFGLEYEKKTQKHALDKSKTPKMSKTAR